MSNTEMVVVEHEHALAHPLSAAKVRERINLIQEVMRGVMKDGTHFGVIPGASKPSLLKAGSEVLLATFKLAVDPVVEDLSTADEARYRVTCRLTSTDGTFLGAGVGEASSDEEKYKWRAAVSELEFEAYPAERRRLKYLKNGGTITQVRMNVADVRNTVLKMAKKRSQIDGCLTVLGASDIFTQDIEDMPTEYIQQETLIRPTQRAGAPTPTSTSPTPTGTSRPSAPSADQPSQARHRVPGKKITDAQRRRLYAIYKGAGYTDETVKAYLKATYNIDHGNDILMDDYEAICAHFSSPAGETAEKASEKAPF
jgi:hypothetical protein